MFTLAAGDCFDRMKIIRNFKVPTYMAAAQVIHDVRWSVKGKIEWLTADTAKVSYKNRDEDRVRYYRIVELQEVQENCDT